MELKQSIEDKLRGLQTNIMTCINIIKVSENEITDIKTNPDDSWDDLNRINNLSELGENCISQLNDDFDELWKLSDEKNYYWHFCSLKVYEHHYEDFKKEFLNKLPEAELEDFFEHEINYILSSRDSQDAFNHTREIKDYFLTLNYYEYLSKKNKLKINIVNKQKGEFLIGEAFKSGHSLKASNTKKVTVYEDYENDNTTDNETSSNILIKCPLEFSGIFKDNKIFNLFRFLDENVITLESKIKYVSIYNYLNNQQYLICNQLQYIQFIFDYKEITISKITKGNYKYKTKTLPLLKSLEENFNELTSNIKE